MLQDEEGGHNKRYVRLKPEGSESEMTRWRTHLEEEGGNRPLTMTYIIFYGFSKAFRYLDIFA